MKNYKLNIGKIQGCGEYLLGADGADQFFLSLVKDEDGGYRISIVEDDTLGCLSEIGIAKHADTWEDALGQAMDLVDESGLF